MKRILHLLAALGSCASLLVILAPASADAPTVTTSGAINVTGTSATLVGFIDSGSVLTGYTFAYGTTASYGQFTPIASIPSGSGLQEVTATVTSLTPGTKYHFQLYGFITLNPSTPAMGGGDQTFTTTSSSGSGSGSGTGTGTGSGASGKGSLRLVGRTLQVSHGKVLVALWCLGKHACRGGFSISSSRKSCVSGKSFSLGAGKVKAVDVKVRGACRTLMRKAARHTIRGKLKATLSTGQPKLSSKVTLTPRL